MPQKGLHARQKDSGQLFEIPPTALIAKLYLQCHQDSVAPAALAELAALAAPVSPAAPVAPAALAEPPCYVSTFVLLLSTCKNHYHASENPNLMRFFPHPKGFAVNSSRVRLFIYIDWEIGDYKEEA
jgi:hypothetical protein